jgi:hypothetical protein
MKNSWLKLGFSSLVGVIGATSISCTDSNPCHKNPTEYVDKYGAPEHQVNGKDGLCYAVDPEVPNWGGACGDSNVCGGGLICAAPDLPICTNINCNPDPKLDTVCPKEGFTCVKTGKATPASICIPKPAAKPAAAAMPAPSVAPAAGPNIGTTCGDMGDPVCVNGAMCPGNPALPYCTVMSCSAGADNEKVCAAAGGTCYTGAGAPADGICTVDPSAAKPEPAPAATPNIGTTCGDMGDPVCVNGAMCPGNPALPYCTVMSCSAGADNEKVCTAAGGTCYTGAGAPADGICTVDPSAAKPEPAPAATPNIGTACGDMGDPVCVNGAMCPGNPALPYCTVMSCVAGADNEAVCTAAGGSCYTGAGAPPDGICTVQ